MSTELLIGSTSRTAMVSVPSHTIPATGLSAAAREWLSARTAAIANINGETWARLGNAESALADAVREQEKAQ